MKGYSEAHVEAVVRVVDYYIAVELSRIRGALRQESREFVREQRRGFRPGREPTEPRDAAWRRRDEERRRARHLREENARAEREIARWLSGGAGSA